MANDSLVAFIWGFRVVQARSRQSFTGCGCKRSGAPQFGFLCVSCMYKWLGVKTSTCFFCHSTIYLSIKTRLANYCLSYFSFMPFIHFPFIFADRTRSVTSITTFIDCCSNNIAEVQKGALTKGDFASWNRCSNTLLGGSFKRDRRAGTLEERGTRLLVRRVARKKQNEPTDGNVRKLFGSKGTICGRIYQADFRAVAVKRSSVII